MYLERIEIENFKSFKTFSSIDLSPNTTIIVGKNGSGKSNIIHAIRVVICCEKLSRDERIDLLHEGTNISEELGILTLHVNNSDLRLDGPKQFKLKRCIGVDKDEYYVNEKLTNRKDVQGLIENSGICVSMPYFIVQQGKISEMINMTDSKRYDLVKNISGALKYEHERDSCLKMLNETELTKKKLDMNMKLINDKLKNLETEKSKMEICDNLEKEKRRYEIAYIQKDLVLLNKQLEEIDQMDNNESVNEEYEDVEYELKLVNEKITNLEKEKMQIDMFFSGSVDKENKPEIKNSKSILKDGGIDILKKELSLADNKLQNINKQIKICEDKIKNCNDAEKNVFIEKTYLKNVINFLKEFDNKKDSTWLDNELKHSRDLLEDKKKFIDENKSTNDVFNFQVLNKMMEKRKELWREEKRLVANENGLMESLRNNENKLLISGHYSYKVYKDLKAEDGVIGCVFDLFDVPDELSSAFEAVSGGYLFNIVVEDEKVVSRLINKVTGNVTFIPINKMFAEECMEIEDPNLFLMSAQISCDSRFKSLLSYITKNSYVAPDLKTGARLSKTYNVNIVTLEGDIFRKNGMITGGYESKSSVVRDFKKIVNQKKENLLRLQGVRSKLSKLNLEIETIEKIQKQNDGSLTEMDLVHSICKFLEEKIHILQNKGHKIKYYENKLENVCYKTIGLKSELIKLESELDDLKKEKEDLDTRKTKFNRFIEILTRYKDEMTDLKNREEYLKNKEIKNFTGAKGSCKFKKENLIMKKEVLLKKMGMTSDINMEILHPELDKNRIAENLKKINDELKKYIFLNRRNLDQWSVYIEQKNDLKKRQDDLKNNYDNIINFIKDLDQRKDDKMNATFEMIKNNFDFFSKKLCNFDVRLDKINETLSIKVSEGDLKSLSGGQKTMVAICLIFSIQKVDPSPFYIFDEVDANLDQEGRSKITSLFKELSVNEKFQFIMTTFREELVNCGDKFIGVSYSDKKSYVSEVEKNIVFDFLTNNEN
jgi:structural maintenance of chromosome 3 (chondroitin sulfate proteoglycan 6)